ncbi:hypothetical protein [Candidatus Endomicrobiellum trichonymphae]|uniref:hypothetical protein n=1 Tax=Endomicrobium trichonymphae TaxID=1408204 RepID=UPI000BAA5C31|nr:hypothetical protein [Candidatus Endomicrobium trichonymphae]
MILRIICCVLIFSLIFSGCGKHPPYQIIRGNHKVVVARENKKEEPEIKNKIIYVGKEPRGFLDVIFEDIFAQVFIAPGA